MDGKGVVWWQQVTQKADVLDSREGQNIRLPEIAIPALEPPNESQPAFREEV